MKVEILLGALIPSWWIYFAVMTYRGYAEFWWLYE